LGKGRDSHQHQAFPETTARRLPTKLINYIRNPSTPLPEQRRALDLLRQLNLIEEKRDGEDSQLDSSIQAAGNRLPDAERSAGSFRYHQGAGSHPAAATATMISDAAA